MKKGLIIGAGSAGKRVYEELQLKNEMEILGFLDKDSLKFGKQIGKTVVLGNYDEIEKYVENLSIDTIIVATTEMSGIEIKEKIKEKLCDKKIEIYTLPDIEDLSKEKSLNEQLKKINIGLSIPNLDVEPIIENLKECIETGWVSTGGRFIPEFEEKMAKYLGVKEAVGIQSGTAGLHTSLRVLGVERDNEVIVPTLTFIAAVNPVTYLGAIPVFIDCDDTLCIDPLKIERFLENECNFVDGKVINKKTGRQIKVIVAVHVFGNMADMEKILEIAHKYNLKVLEDATEALGTFYTEGKYKGKAAGTIGDFGVFSFNANKIITTGGGGMVVSNNKELLDKVRFLSVQAKTNPLYFIHDEIGYNYRMLNLQAALGTTQIDRIEEFVATKIRNYERYKEGIKDIDGLEIVPFNKNIRANYWFYSIVVDKEKYGLNKDELLQKLVESNIQIRPIWGLIHEQKPYVNNEAYEMEKSLWYHERVLNVPCSTNLTSEEVDIVLEKLREFKK